MSMLYRAAPKNVCQVWVQRTPGGPKVGRLANSDTPGNAQVQRPSGRLGPPLSGRSPGAKPGAKRPTIRSSRAAGAQMTRGARHKSAKGTRQCQKRGRTDGGSIARPYRELQSEEQCVSRLSRSTSNVWAKREPNGACFLGSGSSAHRPNSSFWT